MTYWHCAAGHRVRYGSDRYCVSRYRGAELIGTMSLCTVHFTESTAAKVAPPIVVVGESPNCSPAAADSVATKSKAGADTPA